VADCGCAAGVEVRWLLARVEEMEAGVEGRGGRIERIEESWVGVRTAVSRRNSSSWLREVSLKNK
jgi:hypothetical protein